MSHSQVNSDTLAADPVDGLFIPSPPDLFNQVRAATPNLIKIGEILATDAGLSSEVLRVVNSPAFGMHSPIASITHATSMLGLDHILNIVNGVLLRQYAKGVNSADLNQLFGNDHVKVSHLIAIGWFLPNEICTAIVEHHSVTADMFDCEQEQDKKVNQLIAVLKISEHLSAIYQKLGGQQQDHEWGRIGDTVMEYLDLGEAGYLALEEKLVELKSMVVH